VIHEYLLENNFPFEQNKKIGFQANKNLLWKQEVRGTPRMKICVILMI
jgi:hypothetical protein